MADGKTRRELIGGGPLTGSDRRALATALRLQSLGLWVYDRVLEHGRLDPGPRRLIEALRRDEREHLTAVGSELTVHGHLTLPGWTLRSASAELSRHGVGASVVSLQTQHDSLRLLIDVESMLEGAWFSAIAKLRDPRLAGLAARIMACEAQHWTVLSSVSHHGDPKLTVPYPFVRGSSGY